MELNLPPPAGFQGLQPDKPIVTTMRNLPHWRQDGATYFVTFCLADALPQSRARELMSIRREWETRHPHPRSAHARKAFQSLLFQRLEDSLDMSYGKCWFAHEKYANELHRAILHFHNIRYEIGCFVLMGNHCHLTIRPFADINVSNEIGSIKSVVANFVNRHERVSGRLWRDESYDRIVRDIEHLFRVVQYIGGNPRKAKLPPKTWHRWLNPDWARCGWQFLD